MFYEKNAAGTRMINSGKPRFRGPGIQSTNLKKKFFHMN
jgi:hypothetical protein